MKRKCCVRVTLFRGALIAAGLLATGTPAQNNPEERAASLRAQLVEAQARQAELHLRLQQLDENLKSENIERSLAGVGSTRPEELREAPRRRTSAPHVVGETPRAGARRSLPEKIGKSQHGSQLAG
jgi:hypothetical protein